MRVRLRTTIMDGVRPLPDRPGGRAGADGGARTALAEILRGVAKGDDAAFARLYDETAPRVYGLVLRVLRDPAQAEEVTQEVYLEVWRTAARFDPARGSAPGWLMTIAHRRAVDRVRSSHAEVLRDRAYEARTHVAEADTTAEQATGRLEARRVHVALAALTEHQREAVTLAYSAGTPIARWPACSSCRSAPPRPGSGTA